MSDASFKNFIGRLGGDLAHVLQYTAPQPCDQYDDDARPEDTNRIEDHVYVAFLRSSVLEDPDLPFMSWLGSFLKNSVTGGGVVHTELFFINERREKVTYMVTSLGAAQVEEVKGKDYSRREEYEVYAIPMSTENIKAMRAFARKQVGKSYDFSVYCNYLCVCPYAETDEAFNCAQLTTRILQVGGMFNGYDAQHTSDTLLYKLVRGVAACKADPHFDWQRDVVEEGEPYS